MKYIHKTLILSVFIHVNNFILSPLRQPLLLTHTHTHTQRVIWVLTKADLPINASLETKGRHAPTIIVLVHITE